ncbi:hypothetical protein GALL_473610 [mine drainage metagenome]|uniref:GAF domain-containing protein n=1 Tax=mine drainage metagenome TaxID=410659 RepID=A0A1J5PHE5_9ZZZZ
MTPEQSFAQAIATARQPIDAFAALDRLTQELLGAKLFTVTTVEENGALARRSYSNMPAAYPTSGTKRVDPSRWNNIVLERHESFVANTLADIATVFPDHELIGSLGLGSCINMPILVGGEVIATLNLLDAPGYFTPERVALIAERLTLPALAAQLAYDRLSAR